MILSVSIAKKALALMCVLLCVPAFSFEHSSEKSDFKRPNTIRFPEHSAYSPQKAALGKLLFFDPRLSGAQNMSCSTCHNPSFGWETPMTLAIGALNQHLERHSPTVENLAESEFLFWDGRVKTLEEQAKTPITNPIEMNSKLSEVIKRLSAIETYVHYFNIAFPSKGLTRDTLLDALATYQRTLRSRWAPFDDWVMGNNDAFSKSAKRGFDLFTGKANCALCHQGWAFTDHGFHNIGIESNDLGRGTIVKGMERMFKTPGLRNIARRAPYMHNGSIASLQEVLEHYRSPPDNNNDLTPLDLSQDDINDIIAFLNALTSYDSHIRTPVLPAK